MLSRFAFARGVVAALCVIICASVLGTAGAQTQDDIDEARRRQEQVRADAQDAAEDIDVLEAESDELLAAIEALQANVDLTSAQLLSAEQNLRASQFSLASVNSRIDELEAERDQTELSLRTSAIEQFIDGEASSSSAFLSAEEPITATLRQRLYDVAGGSVAETLEQLRALDAELAVERETSLALVAQAAADEAATAELAEQAAAALDLQESIAGQVNERLSARLAEASALAEIDAGLSNEIRLGEEAIAAEAARLQAVIDAQNQVNNNNNSGGGDSGGGNAGTSDAGNTDSGNTDVVVGRGDRSVPTPSLTTVRGIRVNSAIAGRLESMLAAAAADGIVLGGGGYRDSEAQIRLRIAHCGNTEYLIWDAPASACSPPTARPGESNHEKGLAIDFTVNGSAIRSRSSSAFQWLAANAGSYGFINLPSEPWHWSTNGN